ncbi:MAG: DinB family protein [Chloroflexi bacterium]|nr:DinB family protein [Chloroflexota bacterium]MBI5350393.1 DinB family protein [Chloroflexota bacterium]
MELDQTLEILERTPATLRAILEGLSADWTHTHGDPDSWSPSAVVGHLIHGEETNWLPRAEMILQHGESRPFESFDRTAQFDRLKDQSLDQLLNTFEQLRRQNIARLKTMRLTSAQLSLGGTHPELGAVTLRQLLATWVVHDLNHIGQIVEAMSKRYVEAVGPWKAYLPILSR